MPTNPTEKKLRRMPETKRMQGSRSGRQAVALIANPAQSVRPY